MSSVWSRPAWWASASRATHCAGGGEQDPVAGLAGPDRQAGGQVGLAGAGWAEEDHVLLGGDEVQGAQVGDQVAFEAAGVVEVELLQALAGGEPGGADAALAAVGLPGGDLALQAGDQELLVGPGLGAGPFGQPGRPPRAGWAPSAPGSGTRPRRSGPGRLAVVVRGGLAGGHRRHPPSSVDARSMPSAVS